MHTGQKSISTVIRRHSIYSLFWATLIIVMCGVMPAYGQNYTWTGNINADWNNPGNWSPTAVPTANSTVTVGNPNGNPYPVINSDVNIAALELSDWSSGELTVTNGASLTLTDKIDIRNYGHLFISDGATLHLSGNNFSMGYTDTRIQMSGNSTFISDADVQLNGLLYGGSGTLLFNGLLDVQSNKVFNVENASVDVYGQAIINGTYNGDDGYTTFHSTTEIKSGGVVNLDNGTIDFLDYVFVGSRGDMHIGSGTVNFSDDIEVASHGVVTVDVGSLNITGSATFVSNGTLDINTGTVNVGDGATMQSDGNVTFNSGTFNVDGTVSVSNGSSLNTGDSNVYIAGDVAISNGSELNAGGSTIEIDGGSLTNDHNSFNADSSTVVFSGPGPQYINGNTTFYNLVVNTDGVLNSNGDITVQNDATIGPGSTLQMNGSDQLDIWGNLYGPGSINSPRPFIMFVTAPQTDMVIVDFNEPVDPATAEVASNYDINNGISISAAAMDPSDPSRVILTVNLLQPNIVYELRARNITDLETPAHTIKPNHIKYFILNPTRTFYSRSSGSWNDTNSWSLVSHTGAAAGTVPNFRSGDHAIIGNGHTITVSSQQDISIMGTLTVDSSGKLSVDSNGSLKLDTLQIEGTGTFELQSGGTLEIGSTEGISARGTDTGNILTSYRSYSTGANYFYIGSKHQQTGNGLPETVRDFKIDNATGVTVTSSLRVTGTLYLTDGSLTLPSGRELLANDKNIGNGDLIFKRIIDGAAGWRMLSSPVASTYGDFLDGTLTQGYPGAFYDAAVSPNDTLQPNVFYYKTDANGTDNQRWRAPQSADETLTAGRGLDVYAFGRVPLDSRYNNPLPDTLSVRGQEFGSNGQPVDLDVHYSAAPDSGWNLVGNPFGATIDWDKAGSWTRHNIEPTIYVWDPDSQQYLTWNGTTGSLGNGQIAPFQAFWVRANGPDPQLAVEPDAKTFGGSFVGKRRGSDIPVVELKLQSDSAASSIFFSFSDEALSGKDANDAYRLLPPPGSDTPIDFFSVDARGNRYMINALPRRFGIPIDIPVGAGLYSTAGSDQSVTLQWPVIENIPAGWSLTLYDRQTGQRINLAGETSYTFTLSASPDKLNSGSARSGADYNIMDKSDPDATRFVLSVNPGLDANDLPKSVELKQNYPNPFNPATTIRFDLPLQQRVSLKVYNILGQAVATLINRRIYQAGQHSIHWDASSLSSGTYIYRLRTERQVLTRKLTLIK